jgi:rubrerythrin
MDRTEAARLLGGLPKAKRHEFVCPECGTTFAATARGKFCSAICRARDQTKRKTAARRARWQSATPVSN